MIAIWGSLALLTDLARTIPAFQLVAIAFDRAEPSGITAIACLAVVTGAVIASGRFVSRRAIAEQ